MKTTELRLVTHIGMQFKTHWLLKKKVKVAISPAEALLLSKGIEVVDARDVLRPALIEEPYESPNMAVAAPQDKPPCYIFRNSFVPLSNLEQCQLITNSLVFDSLPQSVLDKVQEPTPQDEEAVLKAVLHSHLLDAQQDKLRHSFNYHKYPGYNPPRKYGIKVERKIESLLYQLALHLNQSGDRTDLQHILENVVSRTTLRHGDHLLHLEHKAKMVLCSRAPLLPLAGPREVASWAGAAMPDISPLSPFVHCRVETAYDFREGTGVPAEGSVSPETVWVGHAEEEVLLAPEQFYGMSLVHAFSHAAAFALARDEGAASGGDLGSPVSVNVVHTNGRRFHVGRFQLNTLRLTGRGTRNLFWFEAWRPLFAEARFASARPVVDAVDARPLALLRALC